MADNMDVTPGTGATVAADLVGGALYQRVKLVSGADGVAADVSASDPLPVSLATTLDYANDSVLIRRPWRNQLFNAAAPEVDFGTALTSADYDIRDANAHFYRFFQAEAGYAASRILISSTLNLPLTAQLYEIGIDNVQPAVLFYNEASNVAASTGIFYIGPYAVGANPSAGCFAIVPSLAGPLARFALFLAAVGGSPASGTVTIRLVQQG